MTLAEPVNAVRGKVGLSAQRGHSVLFHRKADLSDWLLYDQSTPSSVDSLALAGGRMFNRNGDLVCTFGQETNFPPLTYSRGDRLPSDASPSGVPDVGSASLHR